ncbi:TraB/GumN family protein [Chryseobacterium limigenitum]|uniref:Uncharacterized protein n=1 Tax=Chryseobacterium limigenitum TaxID=1612149 RepID=A0A1K2IU12_9FLAO|nr:hypothetical protein [Chryseobacterium limigenitum]SFZ95227.1 hypothetical protein SAMN05216324_1096 [Chryseobacterium limigenitum]
MQPEPWTYKTLHDYLDDLFRNKNPDNEEIIQAKTTYRRCYNTRLKQLQREKFKEIIVILSKEELELLKRKLEPQQSVSDYIKKLIVAYLDNNLTTLNPQNNQKKDLTQIEQQLFNLIDYLESLIYQRRFVDNNQIGKLEQQLEQLQQKLESM